MAVVEAELRRPGGQALDGPLEQICGDLALPRGIELLGGLREVAKVGDEARLLAAETTAALDPSKPVSQRTLTRFVTSSASSPRSAIFPSSAARRPALIGRALLEDHERLTVAVDALPGDGRDAGLAEHRDRAPVFAGHHVGEMDLDRRNAGELQRVADRAGVVRPGAGVDDRRVREVDDAVQLLDELALVVGLKEARVEVELDRERVDRLLELQERHARRSAPDRGARAGRG